MTAALSNRELEVLRVLAEGCTDREIAYRLSVSEKAVGRHISAILRKLDITKRIQAAVKEMAYESNQPRERSRR
jgi:DNA-binding NarL/FixJ family response regulator